MTAMLEPESDPRQMLLISHPEARGERRCARCDVRAATWRLTGPDGDEGDLCVYCASLLAT
jgi:hypothetical protein